MHRPDSHSQARKYERGREPDTFPRITIEGAWLVEHRERERSPRPRKADPPRPCDPAYGCVDWFEYAEKAE